jgi:hypothetical protein
MFGMKSRRERRSTSRNRTIRALLQVLGPAAVEGAIQGHSPEAQAHWKRRVEENKRIRREAQLNREHDGRGTDTELLP